MWQPMNSAPIDGTPVLLWSADFEHPDFNPSGVVDGYFDEQEGWTAAIWNGCQDCWNTEHWLEPTWWAPKSNPAMVTEDNEFLLGRIHEIAYSYCPDYPGIKTASPLTQLWAIDCCIDGTNQANQELHSIITELKVEMTEAYRLLSESESPFYAGMQILKSQMSDTQ